MRQRQRRGEGRGDSDKKRRMILQTFSMLCGEGTCSWNQPFAWSSLFSHFDIKAVIQCHHGEVATKTCPLRENQLTWLRGIIVVLFHSFSSVTFLHIAVVFVPSSNFEEGTWRRLIRFREGRDAKNAGNSVSRLLGIRQCGDAGMPPT